MEAKKKNEGRYDEARRNLQLYTDEDLARVWKLACGHAIEIHQWQQIIQEELMSRRTPDSNE